MSTRWSWRGVLVSGLVLAGVSVAVVSRGCRATPAPPTGSIAPAADESALRAARLAKGPDYVPRTRHKKADGTPKYTNRLILETSPYLLQHAHNPVDWFPWGEEAFARARVLGRPVFLSVGYSTCHWCHVMEEESFEDEDVARYLNEHYVSIKVDREERPDVDANYMAFVQSLTGGGGWPMSVWLTPGREPFFGGTYFPPRATSGSRRGFLDVLRERAGQFVNDRVAIEADAKRYAEGLRKTAAEGPPGDAPSMATLGQARTQAARRFDPEMGGARGAPKFPSSFPNRFLLRFARRTRDDEARAMVQTTLDRMQMGGIHDHVGGGFHRYSTDARWLVPHFEKMLYDNALLAVDYLEAAQATGEQRHEVTARETLDYLLRDMTGPDGTFYAATDADSLDAAGRREEGIYFTWTPDEVRAALSPDDARIVMAWLGVTDAGTLDHRSVLHTERSRQDVARQLAIDPSTLDARMAAVRPLLRQTRDRRPRPIRDDKVILAWNALAITAFARAAIVLGEPRYRDAAVRAATVLVASLRAGRDLPHVLVAGQPKGLAFADDVIGLASCLLDVFELTADAAWLSDATKLMDEAERAFGDPARGGYFLTSDRHERLVVREKPSHDGPSPSVSSVAAMTWLRLFAFTGEPRFEQRAQSTLRAFSPLLATRPLAMSDLLLAVDWATDTPKEIVIVVPEGAGALAPSARPLLDVLAKTFVPNATLVVATESALAGDLGRAVAWARDKPARGGAATAYVCERGACKLPTGDPVVFARLIAEVRGGPLLPLIAASPSCAPDA